MGWSDCGDDDLGRPIGYGHEATCDAAGCSAQIHRGLSYVCGGMHGGDGVGCGLYFCTEHKTVGEIENPGSLSHKRALQLCFPCYDEAVAQGVCDVEEDDLQLEGRESVSPANSRPISLAL